MLLVSGFSSKTFLPVPAITPILAIYIYIYKIMINNCLTIFPYVFSRRGVVVFEASQGLEGIAKASVPTLCSRVGFWV